MTATVSRFRLRAAEQRVGFLESESGCDDPEGVAEELNVLCAELNRLDSRLQEAYFDGLPYSDVLSGGVADLFRRWLAVARAVETTAGADELRRNVREVAAMLAPSDGIGGETERLRDAALAEHARGETVAGLGVE